MANRKVNATGRTERTERHVRLTHFLLNSAAYGSLGPAPRALLVEVLKRYTGFNNGSIGLGVREAAAALHVKPQTIGRAFKALQDRGFVAMTRGSSFHQKKLTCEWRVTFLPVGDFQSPTSRPTHDYVHWRAPPEKQKPVPFRDTLSAEKGYRSGQPTKSAPYSVPKRHYRAKPRRPLVPFRSTHLVTKTVRERAACGASCLPSSTEFAQHDQHARRGAEAGGRGAVQA